MNDNVPLLELVSRYEQARDALVRAESRVGYRGSDEVTEAHNRMTRAARAVAEAAHAVRP